MLVRLLFKYKSIKLESILYTSNICTKQRQTLLTQNKCSKIFKYILSGVFVECFHLGPMLNQNKVKEFSLWLNCVVLWRRRGRKENTPKMNIFLGWDKVNLWREEGSGSWIYSICLHNTLIIFGLKVEYRKCEMHVHTFFCDWINLRSIKDNQWPKRNVDNIRIQCLWK